MQKVILDDKAIAVVKKFIKSVEPNLKDYNIKKDVNILDVIGTYVGNSEE